MLTRTDNTYGNPTLEIFAPCYSTYGTTLENDNANNILVYEPLKKISIKGKIYDFSQITGYSVSVNPFAGATTRTSTGSMLGRAALGGVLFGGVGAIIGASSARKETEYETRTFFTIYTNSLSEPSIVLDLILPDKERVAQIEGVLRIITANNSPFEPTPDEQIDPPVERIKMGDVATIKQDGREVVIIDIKEEDGEILYLGMGDDDSCYYREEELERSEDI